MSGVSGMGAGGDAGANGDPPPRPDSTADAGGPTGLKWSRLGQVVNERKVDFALWATRLLTMGFALAYVLPFTGNPVQAYYKAFMASAATSALRLHQRLPNFSFSRAFLEQMVLEDSFHYLFCSLIFLYASPMTLALGPHVLFALLHFASFSMILLEAVGLKESKIAKSFKSLIEYKSVTLLRMAAGAEIFIMWFLVAYTLVGRNSLISPFFYFRFLTFRYASRRNHYTRTMFYELRIMLDRFALSSKCPGFLATGIRGLISVVSRFAPPTATAS